MSEYTDEELDDALRKAFVVCKYEAIAIWSRHERFQLEAVAYAERNGWMESELIEIDEQSSKLVAKLSVEGKKHFGIGGTT